jgi:hypothetical protein
MRKRAGADGYRESRQTSSAAPRGSRANGVVFFSRVRGARGMNGWLDAFAFG